MGWLGKHGLGAAAAGLVAALGCLTAGGPASAADDAFTVGNYPVDAVAGDAVTAKQKALADGQQAAFRSLLKRLVPVTAYDQLKRVRGAKAAELIDSVVVRQERTSATQYIASLDFSFQPDPVRDLLRREGVPFVDTQAPELVLIPVYVAAQAGQGAAPAGLSPPRGSSMWREVWAGLDLEHALTPVKLAEVKPELTSEVIQKLIDGDGSALTELTRAYASGNVILAVAQPDLAKERLNVALTGRDAVGAFVLNRSYRLALDDVAYTGETAAVVSLGILEGRWKATQVSTRVGGGTRISAGSVPVQMIIEFRSMQQWQQMYQRLARVPGLENLQVGGLSARSADVGGYYPGGAEALAGALAAQGLDVRQLGGTLQVRPAL